MYFLQSMMINQEFLMKWYELPTCTSCNKQMKFSEPDGVTAMEFQNGAITADMYRCPTCYSGKRFPRFRKLSKLAENPVGGHLECLILSTSMFKELGFPLRVVTGPDDMWLELWIEELQQFIYVDPVSNVINSPESHEIWWKIPPKWAIAVGDTECVEVTLKYVTNIEEIISSRGNDIDDDLFMRLIPLLNEMYGEGVEKEDYDAAQERQSLDLEKASTIGEYPKSETYPPRLHQDDQ